MFQDPPYVLLTNMNSILHSVKLKLKFCSSEKYFRFPSLFKRKGISNEKGAYGFSGLIRKVSCCLVWVCSKGTARFFKFGCTKSLFFNNNKFCKLHRSVPYKFLTLRRNSVLQSFLVVVFFNFLLCYFFSNMKELPLISVSDENVGWTLYEQ